jgi:hypothetical protein
MLARHRRLRGVTLSRLPHSRSEPLESVATFLSQTTAQNASPVAAPTAPGNPKAKTKGRAIKYTTKAPITSGGNRHGPTSGINMLGSSGAIKNAAVTAAF